MRNLATAEISRMQATANSVFDDVSANTGCTIYNKYISNRSEKYQRTQVSDVQWQDKKAANVLASGGNIEANQAEIVIPFARGEDYIEPKGWQAFVDKTGFWTLQLGDVIVKGIVEDEITDGDDNPSDDDPSTPAFTVSDLMRKYDSVLVITSVDTIDRSVAFKHWKIGAK